MNLENIIFALVIAMTVLAMAGYVAIAYGHKSGNAALVAALEQFGYIFEGGFARGDVALAKYGEQLKPVYELSSAGLTLIDEPTDFLAALLPDAPEEALREFLTRLQQLSDGKPIVINPGNPEAVVSVDAEPDQDTTEYGIRLLAGGTRLDPKSWVIFDDGSDVETVIGYKAAVARADQRTNETGQPFVAVRKA